MDIATWLRVCGDALEEGNQEVLKDLTPDVMSATVLDAADEIERLRGILTETGVSWEAIDE